MESTARLRMIFLSVLVGLVLSVLCGIAWSASMSYGVRPFEYNPLNDLWAGVIAGLVTWLPLAIALVIVLWVATKELRGYRQVVFPALGFGLTCYIISCILFAGIMYAFSSSDGWGVLAVMIVYVLNLLLFFPLSLLVVWYALEAQNSSHPMRAHIITIVVLLCFASFLISNVLFAQFGCGDPAKKGYNFDCQMERIIAERTPEKCELMPQKNDDGSPIRQRCYFQYAATLGDSSACGALNGTDDFLVRESDGSFRSVSLPFSAECYGYAAISPPCKDFIPNNLGSVDIVQTDVVTFNGVSYDIRYMCDSKDALSWGSSISFRPHPVVQ